MKFLNFIRHLSETAADNAILMEELIYKDPSSAITKARIFSEEIIKKVFQFEKFNNNEDIDRNISNLAERIYFLSQRKILTREIEFELHNVRKLGNKAAHQGDYNNIVDAFKAHKSMYNIALWFYEKYSNETQEVHKYTYPMPPQSNLDSIYNIKEEIEQVVKEALVAHLGSNTDDNTEEIDEINIEETISHKNESLNKSEETTSNGDPTSNVLYPLNLNENESYLLRELSRLQDSSKEAVENYNEFSQYKKYLHVERKIQSDFENVLRKCQEHPEKPQLILLCGSVGDGKSHLLAYFNSNKRELLEDFEVFNDATESFSPSKNSMETLQELLKDFSDQGFQSNKKIIIAMNLGVLHNFISTKHEYPFNNLKELIDESEIFTSNVTTLFQKDWLSIINFSDYQNYELTKNGVDSPFFRELLKKIVSADDNNPFYQAYLLDLKRNVRNMLHYNYELLQLEVVQSRIIQLIIQTIIQYKLVISARAFLNFIADILIPENLNDISMNDFEIINNSLPFLLFHRKDRSLVQRYISELNPMNTRSSDIDEAIILLNTSKNWRPIFEKYVTCNQARDLLNSLSSPETLDEGTVPENVFVQISETLILFAYMTNDEFFEKLQDEHYLNFVQKLYYFNFGNKMEMRSVYEDVKEAIFNWKGYPSNYKNYIFLTSQLNDQYHLAQMLDIRPAPNYSHLQDEEKLHAFKSTITVTFSSNNSGQTFSLEIDYPLYCLIQKVRDGYCPNKHDEEDAITFVEFIENLLNNGSKKDELLVYFPSENMFYKFFHDDYLDSVVFEKE